MVLRTRLRCAPRILGRPAWFDETLGCRACGRRGGVVEGIGCLARGGTGACVGLGWVAAAGPDLFPSLSSCSRFVQSVCQNLCRLPRTATSSWSRHSCCPCVVISIAAGPMAMAPLFTAPPAVPPLPLSMYAFPCARRVRRCTSSYVPCALRFGRPPLPGPMLPKAPYDTTVV